MVNSIGVLVLYFYNLDQLIDYSSNDHLGYDDGVHRFK